MSVSKGSSAAVRRSSPAVNAERVAIARALANEPRLLLADEPTGSLDADSVQRVLDLLSELHRRRDLTIILVTHDPVVAAAAERRIHIERGRVAAEPVHKMPRL